MSHCSRLSCTKKNKEEHELHIIINPLLDSRLQTHVEKDDLQAPLISRRLSPHSKWIIVRNNLNQIRSWGGNPPSDANQPFADWRLLFQMRRELRRIKEDIRGVHDRSDFVPVRRFSLPIDERHRNRINVSHVQSLDVIYHPGFGQEPMLLQSLLYYFSKECFVPHSSIFQPFLTNVCSVVCRNRQRLNEVNTHRKIALVLAIIVYIMLSVMVFSLIFSVFKTTSNFQKLYENELNRGIECMNKTFQIDSLHNARITTVTRAVEGENIRRRPLLGGMNHRNEILCRQTCDLFT